MTALDLQTPEQHRQRYDALRAQAQARSTRPPVLACPPIPPSQVVLHETIPGGWYWSSLLPHGRTLRIAAGSSVSILLWNAYDTSERFSAPDTVKVQWTVRLGAGLLLLSDMGRALASITADDTARHDVLVGGSTAATNAARYGRHDHRNTRDNILLAVGKHGLDRRDVSPCLTLFADVRADAAGRLAWHGGSPAGGAVDLRAEMDLLVALSNCPHPLDPAPAYAPPPAEATIWDAGPVPQGDPCRTSSPEAVRAFENNARMLRG